MATRVHCISLSDTTIKIGWHLMRAKDLKHYPDHLNGVQQLGDVNDYTDAQEGTKLCLAEWQPCHFTIIIYHLGDLLYIDIFCHCLLCGWLYASLYRFCSCFACWLYTSYFLHSAGDSGGLLNQSPPDSVGYVGGYGERLADHVCCARVCLRMLQDSSQRAESLLEQ